MKKLQIISTVAVSIVCGFSAASAQDAVQETDMMPRCPPLPVVLCTPPPPVDPPGGTYNQENPIEGAIHSLEGAREPDLWSIEQYQNQQILQVQ